MTTVAEPRLMLPVPRRMTLKYFSLYKNRETIDVEFGDGVFCLVGANGLGKSTFLAALNYAITGLVADPDRKFDSLSEYYRYSSPYARSYFSGRIDPMDQDVASVRLEMRVGDREYTLERGFFEAESLRLLEVVGPGGARVVENDASESDTERNGSYKRLLVQDCGLARFEQLVFLQHFVLTFDERRRLLLWDERTIEQALLLTFGVDPETAQQADDWRRKAERFDSQARNLQYQATTARSRIADLQARITTSAESADDGRDFEERERERKALQAEYARIERDIAGIEVEEAQAQAELVAAEQAYEEAFASALTPHAQSHPLVVSSLDTDACAVCGSAGAAARISGLLDAGVCPLCGESLENLPESRQSDLESLDRLVSERRSRVEALRRRSLELRPIRDRLTGQLASEAVGAREGADVGVLDAVIVPGSVAQSLISQYEREAAEATRRRDEFREKRDELRRRLQPVSRELARRYTQAEEVFVPRFVELAHQFLGLDVSVYLQQRSGRPELVVSVGGAQRRSHDQLSESQRYFLDIALRMAVAQHIAGDVGLSSLYIDTPEGSLDISYEARAGMMFANFARSRSLLVMTANVNTSRLLQALATECGPDRMKIVRMMEWTQLSDVQADGEALFEEALAELSAALHRASPDQ